MGNAEFCPQCGESLRLLDLFDKPTAIVQAWRGHTAVRCALNQGKAVRGFVRAWVMRKVHRI